MAYPASVIGVNVAASKPLTSNLKMSYKGGREGE